MIFLNTQVDECAFVLMRIVPRHLRMKLVFGIDQSKFYKKLAAVADSQAEGVITCKECIKCFLRFVVV